LTGDGWVLELSGLPGRHWAVVAAEPGSCTLRFVGRCESGRLGRDGIEAPCSALASACQRSRSHRASIPRTLCWMERPLRPFVAASPRYISQPLRRAWPGTWRRGSPSILYHSERPSLVSSPLRRSGSKPKRRGAEQGHGLCVEDLQEEGREAPRQVTTMIRSDAVAEITLRLHPLHLRFFS
jgi:hypothetical protein